MCFHPSASEVVLYNPGRKGYLYFQQPETVLSTGRLEDIPAILHEVEQQVNRRGRFAAGFLSYEAAPAFDRAFRVRTPSDSNFPLVWFGIYAQPEFLSPQIIQVEENLASGPWRPDIARPDYVRAIQQVKEHIACGETYQVNFTYRLHAPFTQSAWSFFAALAGAHTAPYAAFLETEDWAVASISPELFFTLDGETLTSRPMKGTAPRGLMLEDDEGLADWLYHSEKNRAENVMIVDMVRNDMGRIARIGSVRVPHLFQVEKYPTVWQMTSTVQAETNASFFEILQALFPAASITGAPKIRTMQIIAALESSPRRVYTGAFGCLAPGRLAQFNVAIRTLLVDKSYQLAEYGVGGGIVWDSSAGEEWDETITKSRILYERPQPFELLETMRWTPEGGWFLLDKHLDRLARSAEYFAYPLDLPALCVKLTCLVDCFQDAPHKVRLRLAANGQTHLEHQTLDLEANPTRIGIAKTAIDSSDRFLYHKTTRRDAYHQALADCPGYEDVLLWNARREATESCIANLVVDLKGRLYTPPVESGLLTGTYRAWLLEQGKVKERRISLDELEQCSQIYLANSVRGMWKVEISYIPVSNSLSMGDGT